MQIRWKMTIGPKATGPVVHTHYKSKAAPPKPAPKAPKESMLLNAAYGLVKGLGDGFLTMVSGPSDPRIKRRVEIAELRRAEVSALRDAQRQLRETEQAQKLQTGLRR